MDDQKNVKFSDQIKFELIPYQIEFKKPAKTSRDTLVVRQIYFIKAFFKSNATCFGIGECAPIFGLSPEKNDELVDSILATSERIEKENEISFLSIPWPSIRFAFETAIFDLLNGGKRIIFPDFKKSPIPINGLVWMNERIPMLEEAFTKIEQNFQVIKLKIGGIDFEEECKIIHQVREAHPNVVIRLDANGSFSTEEALEKLQLLSKYQIHSIEQPIKAGQWDAMRTLTQNSPIPIALDEELIGVEDRARKTQLLEHIQPQYIILKPSLHGGFYGCNEWIDLATSLNLKWWATSMLESSIGLNAIAQWLSKKTIVLEQGLGTGGLYSNNLPPAWNTEDGKLHFYGLEQLQNYHFE